MGITADQVIELARRRGRKVDPEQAEAALDASNSLWMSLIAKEVSARETVEAELVAAQEKLRSLADRVVDSGEAAARIAAAEAALAQSTAREEGLRMALEEARSAAGLATSNGDLIGGKIENQTQEIAGLRTAIANFKPTKEGGAETELLRAISQKLDLIAAKKAPPREAVVEISHDAAGRVRQMVIKPRK